MGISYSKTEPGEPGQVHSSPGDLGSIYAETSTSTRSSSSTEAREAEEDGGPPASAAPAPGTSAAQGAELQGPCDCRGPAVRSALTRRFLSAFNQMPCFC